MEMSFDRVLGIAGVFGILIGVAVAIAMDPKDKGEMLFSIGCFVFSGLALSLTIGIWIFRSDFPSVARILISALSFAIIGPSMLEASRWAAKRYERSIAENGKKSGGDNSSKGEDQKTGEPSPQPVSALAAQLSKGEVKPKPSKKSPGVKVPFKAEQSEKPGKVEVLPPTTATVDVAVKQAPKEEVTAKVEHLSPEEIQESARGLLRECRGKFSDTMQGISFFVNRNPNTNTGVLMAAKEWEAFTEDYNKNFKVRMLDMYRLLLTKVASQPQTNVDAERVFNPPGGYVGWEDVRDQLKYLFLLLNEFEREKGLPITTSI
jgi:hypothetical protein